MGNKEEAAREGKILRVLRENDSFKRMRCVPLFSCSPSGRLTVDNLNYLTIEKSAFVA